MMRSSFLAVLVFVAVGSAYAQRPNIESYITMIEGGQADQVRNELPNLLNQYPNNPGVFYLQAMLTTDGAEAVRLYQNIVDKYPTNEWADDALYRVYKFYYAIGLYRTAEIKLNQLRANYPDSRYVEIERELAGTTETPRQEPAGDPASQRDTAAGAQVVPPKDPAPAPLKTEEPAPVPAPATPYTVQVGVFSTMANANKQKTFLTYQRYQAEVAPKMSGGRQLYAVYVGNYATAEEARAKGEEIKRAFNIDFIVVTR